MGKLTNPHRLCFPESMLCPQAHTYGWVLASEGTDGRLEVGGKKGEAATSLSMVGFPVLASSLVSPANFAMTYLGSSLH